MNDITAASATQSYYQANFDSSVDPMDTREALLEEIKEMLSSGSEAFANEFANEYGQAFVDEIKELISAQEGIPQAKKDEIMEMLDETLAENKLDSTEEAVGVMEQIREMIQEMAKEDVKEAGESVGEGATNEGGSATGGADPKNGGGAGNWMVKLAKAMGQVAGNHLKKMIEIQEEIGQLESAGGEDSEKAAAMAELTAELQAHTQMFKMMQEAMTSVIKTLGEALHGTVRKQ